MKFVIFQYLQAKLQQFQDYKKLAFSLLLEDREGPFAASQSPFVFIIYR